MSDTSRNTRYYRQRLPRRKRTIPIYSEKEDTGRFFKCWYCGFKVDSDRFPAGDGDGTTQLSTPDIAGENFGSGDANSIMIILDDKFTLLQNNPNGTPKIDYKYNIYPAVIAGCPQCGCLNYR